MKYLTTDHQTVRVMTRFCEIESAKDFGQHRVLLVSDRSMLRQGTKYWFVEEIKKGIKKERTKGKKNKTTKERKKHAKTKSKQKKAKKQRERQTKANRKIERMKRRINRRKQETKNEKRKQERNGCNERSDSGLTAARLRELSKNTALTK